MAIHEILKQCGIPGNGPVMVTVEHVRPVEYQQLDKLGRALEITEGEIETIDAAIKAARAGQDYTTTNSAAHARMTRSMVRSVVGEILEGLKDEPLATLDKLREFSAVKLYHKNLPLAEEYVGG